MRVLAAMCDCLQSHKKSGECDPCCFQGRRAPCRSLGLFNTATSILWCFFCWCVWVWVLGFFSPLCGLMFCFFFLLLCFFAFPIVCAGSLLNSIKNVLNVIFLQVCFSRHPLGPVGLALAWFESWQIHSDFALGPLTRQMGLTSKETCVFCHLVCCNASLH